MAEIEEMRKALRETAWDRGDPATESEDGGYRLRKWPTCMSQLWEAIIVNGESCWHSGPWPIATWHPERPKYARFHLHPTAEAARACAAARLADGITMPGPPR